MPSSRQRALSREIILSTALDMVDEEGLSALSLRSLGKRLGVSQAAFYRHFPDKAALLEGISEQVWRLTFEAFLARLQEGEVEVPGGSTAAAGVGANPSSRLMAYMREYAHCLATTLRSHPGTVMLVSSPEEPRSQSLVPPVHICLFDTRKMYDTFHAALHGEALIEAMPTNIILASGPSKTADIQLTLAYGAHGPRDLVVLAVLPDHISPADLEENA